MILLVGSLCGSQLPAFPYVKMKSCVILLPRCPYRLLHTRINTQQMMRAGAIDESSTPSKRAKRSIRLELEVVAKRFCVCAGPVGAGRTPPTTRHAGRSISGSGRSFVTVVQSANHRNADNTTSAGRFEGPRAWCIAFQRQVTSGLVVVFDVLRKNAAQVTLVQYDQVVESFSANRANQPFDERILPRAPMGGKHLVDNPPRRRTKNSGGVIPALSGGGCGGISVCSWGTRWAFMRPTKCTG
jgi:hypothetical protein